jgi:hypothetical protein
MGIETNPDMFTAGICVLPGFSTGSNHDRTLEKGKS